VFYTQSTIAVISGQCLLAWLATKTLADSMNFCFEKTPSALGLCQVLAVYELSFTIQYM